MNSFAFTLKWIKSMNFMNNFSIADLLLRPFFLMWSKTGRASGWLYEAIEKYSPLFSEKKHRRTMLGGATFDCSLKDHVQQKIFFFGVYEPLELNTLLDMVKPGDVVIDAGANIGAYCLPIAKHLNGTVEVHAFEPIPDNFQLLSRNYELSGSPENLHLNQVALWNKAESLEFSLAVHHKNNIGSFTIGKVANVSKKVTCQTITLDTYSQQKKLARVDVIKMDIEGAEKFALEGSLEVIKKFRPKIFIEINKTACQQAGYSIDELIAPLLQLNYRIYKFGKFPAKGDWIKNVQNITQENVILFPEDYDLAKIEYDIKKTKRKFLKKQILKNKDGTLK